MTSIYITIIIDNGQTITIDLKSPLKIRQSNVKLVTNYQCHLFFMIVIRGTITFFAFDDD